MKLASGTLLGEYRVVRLLDENDFTELYTADHPHLPDPVTIALLKGSFTPRQLDELHREALQAGRLEHPHIVRIRACNVEEMAPYLVMDYAPGGSLAACYTQHQRLPIETILVYVYQLASALQYAHDQQFAHGCICPENILLVREGHLRIANFGIAYLAQIDVAAQKVANPSLYMGPEQIVGLTLPASDQYALAVMVYQWLYGEPPLNELLASSNDEEEPAAQEDQGSVVHPALKVVLLKALAREPGERYESVSAFAQAFHAASLALAIGTTVLAYQHHGVQTTVSTRLATTAAWSPDGRYVASGGVDATVRLWDANTGWTIRTLRGHSKRILKIVWSRDGRLLASGSEDGSLRVWQAATGQLIFQCEHFSTSGRALAWSPDGRFLAFSSSKRRVDIEVMEAATGRPRQELKRKKYQANSPVKSLAWSPDGQAIVSASQDGSVHQWKVTSGEQVFEQKRPRAAWRTIVLSEDGELVATASWKESVEVLEARTGQQLLFYKGGNSGHVRELAWSLDGQLILSVSPDGDVQARELGGGREVFHCNIPGSQYIHEVAWSPDGRLLALVRDETIQICEAATGEEVLSYPGHSDWIGQLVWSPDATLLLSTSSRTMQICETQMGSPVGKYVRITSYVDVLAWREHEPQIAVVFTNGSVQLWEADTGQEVLTCKVFPDVPWGTAHSPDNTFAVLNPANSTLEVWEVDTGRQILQYQILTDGEPGKRTAWSPDRTLIASVSGQEVHISHAATEEVLFIYREHSEQVVALAWSPDGRYIASAGHEIRVWLAP